jgi:4'-phosphopantetheinyl transferase EntD
VHDRALRAEEQDQISGLDPAVAWDCVVFSAKESVYKAWFPVMRRWLGMLDATITLDPPSGSFGVLLHAGPLVVDGVDRHELRGRYAVRDGRVVTAVTVAVAATAQP